MTPFATILRRELYKHSITASDLARRIWGSDDKRNGAARNRQVISQYLAGKSQPRLATLERIAIALEMPVEELAPRFDSLECQIEATSESDKVRLKINRDVDHATAMKIIRMLSA